jgi:hypothetical protein
MKVMQVIIATEIGEVFHDSERVNRFVEALPEGNAVNNLVS